MDQGERSKPRSVQHIPRPFTSPSGPRGEAIPLGERSRTVVPDSSSGTTPREQPLYPHGKFKSYEEMLGNMEEEDPFRDPGQPGDRPKTREFLRRGSGHERLREKHEHAIATRQELPSITPKDTVPGEKRTKSEGPKHRRRRRVRDEPSMELSGTYTKETSYTNPTFLPDAEDRAKKNVRKSKPKRSTQKKTLLSGDDVSTGTYTLDLKDEKKKLIFDETDMNVEPVALHSYYKPVDRNASYKRSGDTLKKLRLDSRQGFFSKSNMRGGRKNRAALRRYIHANIKHRQCKAYVHDAVRKEMCKCGRNIPWHIEEGIVVNLHNHRDPWEPSEHTREVPPSCYGEVFFNGFGRESKKTCPYIRITPDTDLEVVFTIMSEYWCLPPPKLLISVTGGAKQFHLKKRLNTVFRRGLIDAARTTSAWIVTGGTNTGVMKMVGEAVKEYQMSSGHADKLVSIGVATWGYVDNLESLEGEDENGCFPASYNIEDLTCQRGSAPLDHNHTHFILVDNGTEHKSGVEIKFRAALEQYMSEKMETVTGVDGDFVNVPVILLVLEGGMNTLQTAAESLKKNMPVVLIQGSGRAADFLAWAFKISKARNKDDGSDFPKDFDLQMSFRAANLFDWSRATEESKTRDIETAVQLARECMADRKLVTVYTLAETMSDAQGSKYVDKAILTALLKANKSNAATQLGLALAWNRCDIARQEIFTPENRPQWQHLQLSNAMFTALVQDRIDFVQLFLDMGVELKRFLTIRRLRDLYDSVLRDKYAGNSRDLLKNLIREVQNSVKHHFFFCMGNDDWTTNLPNLLNVIGQVIQYLLGDQYGSMYSGKKYVCDENETPPGQKDRRLGQDTGLLTSRSNDGTLDLNQSRPGTLRRRATRSNFVEQFSRPEKELFLWAILLNRRELAMMFWKAGTDNTGTALIGSSLLKNLSEKASEEEEIDLANDLLKHSQDLETQANGVLTECYNQDKAKTHLALIRELDNLGKSTLLGIADSGEHMEFMGNPACQTRLNKVWKGNMALYTSMWKIWLGCFIPLIIPWIKFTKGNTQFGKVLGYDDETAFFPSRRKSGPSSDEIINSGALEVDDDDDYTMGRPKKPTKKLYTVSFTGRHNKEYPHINFCNAILFFYTAPITKFIFTSISYLFFLAIFSYMCLVDLWPVSHPNSPSVLEYVIWAWTSTLIIEEVRQILTKDPRSYKYKLEGWFSNIWNRADLVMYLLFILSVVLRYTLPDHSFHYARTCYAVTLAMFYLRFMQTFYVNKDIGPKVIMIRKMLTDVFFFLVIFVVFLLCYGVATKTILYPNSLPTWSLLKDVIYLPYWQMYGELFLENVEGERDYSKCSTNRTLWTTDPNYVQCPESNAAAPIMFAIYMLLTNVLLLNLLIAMFSYTFQNVQENSGVVWRYYRCSLFYEYFDRPALAAPLIIFSHIYRIFKYIIYRCCREPTPSNHDFKVVLSEEDNEKVAEFEKLGMDNYLMKAEAHRRDHIQNRVATAGDRIERVMDELEEIKEAMVVKDMGGEENEEVVRKKDEQVIPSMDPQEEIDALHDRLGGLEERMEIQTQQLIELVSLVRHMHEEKTHSVADARSVRSERSEVSTRGRIEMPDGHGLERSGQPEIEIRNF